jgi:hypothetical protein
VSEKTGAGFIEYIAAVAGFLLGYGVGVAIASAWAVPTDSFLERSAEAGAAIGGILLQYGLGLLAPVIHDGLECRSLLILVWGSAG